MYGVTTIPGAIRLRKPIAGALCVMKIRWHYSSMIDKRGNAMSCCMNVHAYLRCADDNAEGAIAELPS